MTQQFALTDLFNMESKAAVITGGGGMLGYQHASAIAACGGIPVLLDLNEKALASNRRQLIEEWPATQVHTCLVDITKQAEVEATLRDLVASLGRVEILINNAARNPKVERSGENNFSRLENFPIEQWDMDIAVGLGGAFICSKVFGTHMATSGGGVIVNVASDLGVIAPDQRLYRVEGLAAELQPVKPVTYSVIKHGLLGLTKYLATYWCDEGVRCNALSPGGVAAGQNDVFVNRLNRLIPMGRMARPDEYRGAIAFLCSEASSYLNGANLIIDGGRSVW